VFSVSVIYSQKLDSLIQQAIELSPKVKMLQAKREAAYHKIYQNSNLPDPTLVLGVLNLPTNSFSFNQDPMTQKIVGLKQTFPFPGKLSSIEDAAAIDTLIIDQEIKDSKNEIRRDVSTRYYQLSYFQRTIKLSEQSKKLLLDIAEVVNTKYTVATASQQNLLKIQLEITTITDELEELNSRERSVTAELNSFLLRDTDIKINTTEFDDINFMELNVSQLDSLARLNRPYLKGVQLAKEKSELNQRAVGKDYYPDISLGLQYSFREELAATGASLSDLLSVVVGITLPFNYGGKVSSKVEEAVSMQHYYSEQYYSALQNLNGNFGSSVTKLESLEERIKLFEQGLLKQAKQNLTATLSHYQVGHIDFINVIDAEDDLFKIETRLYKLKTNYLSEIAQLEFLTGTILDNYNAEIKK
jgi:outer membrane protein TolC